VPELPCPWCGQAFAGLQKLPHGVGKLFIACKTTLTAWASFRESNISRSRHGRASVSLIIRAHGMGGLSPACNSAVMRRAVHSRSSNEILTLIFPKRNATPHFVAYI